MLYRWRRQVGALTAHADGLESSARELRRDVERQTLEGAHINTSHYLRMYVHVQSIPGSNTYESRLARRYVHVYL